MRQNKIVDDHKVCSKCQITKPLVDYHKNSRNKSGIASWCKSCCNANDASRPPKSRGFAKAYWKNYWLVSNYGITAAEREMLFDAQGRKCAICGVKEDTPSFRWCMDHDHETGRFRAILCHKCNSGLGQFIDSVDVLHKAIAYLEKKVSIEVE